MNPTTANQMGRMTLVPLTLPALVSSRFVSYPCYPAFFLSSSVGPFFVYGPWIHPRNVLNLVNCDIYPYKKYVHHSHLSALSQFKGGIIGHHKRRMMINGQAMEHHMFIY